MMKIEFQTDNAAFDDGNDVAEISRILDKIRDSVLEGHESGLIHDLNGNRIGGWNYDRPEEGE